MMKDLACVLLYISDCSGYGDWKYVTKNECCFIWNIFRIHECGGSRYASVVLGVTMMDPIR